MEVSKGGFSWKKKGIKAEPVIQFALESTLPYL